MTDPHGPRERRGGLIGGTLSHYRITAALGAGGMGEVYRATDTNLGRDVAIKVLPAEVAGDRERLARFQREAHLLASLSHPSIAAIHGLEDADGQPFLVLELVEGEDLAERLKRGPVPLDEALPVARQIAEALEEAHDKGIVHRDLKPANVKVTADGKVKVLDFGLAKAWAGDAAKAPDPDLSHSPTATREGTATGVILGTAAYMSPEQARGRSVDKRTDIWAFGVVLFEMLSGARLFSDETVSDTLAAVLKTEPPWGALPAETPPGLRRLLRHCLERDVKRRLHDIGDARIEIEEALAAGPTSDAVPTGVPPWQPWRVRLPWGLAAASAALVAVAFWRAAHTVSPAPPLSAFAVTLSRDESLPFDENPVLALSDDGRTLVYAAVRADTRQLYRKRLDRIEAEPIAGTVGAMNPFLSPDARWVGFFAEGKLRKVPVEGGTPVTLCRAPNHRGAAWLPDGSILVVPTVDSGLMRVPGAGGTPQPVTTPDTARKERTHRWPHVMPGGRSVLFTIGTLDSPGDYDGASIAMVSLATGERRTVFEGARMAVFAGSGYLLCLRGTTLLAAAFDPSGKGKASAPTAVLDGVGGDPSSGAGYVSLGRDGTLAYVPASALATDLSLVLVDRSGQVTPLPLPAQPYRYPRFSPDGRRLAFSVGTGRGTDDDVWTYDLGSGSLSRLTFDGHSYAPLWSADGTRIVFGSALGGREGLFMKRADGAGQEEALWPQPVPLIPNVFTPDGRTLVLTKLQPSMDLWTVALQGERTPRPFLQEPFAEVAATLSPDGRFVAYSSTETGRAEIFVRSFHAEAGKWQVSTEGGNSPVWSKDGRELYFLAGDTPTVVPVDTRDTFRAGPPRVLFTGPFDTRTEPVTNYDVSRDGRFVMVRRSPREDAARQINVLLNWSAHLPGSAAGGDR